MNNWENSRNRNSYRNRNTLNDQAKSDKAVLEKKDSDNVVILDKVGYVALAEKVILEMKKNKKYEITTTKIRSILRMLNQLQREAVQRQKEELDEEFQSSLQYYKMRCVYEAGREPTVKTFMEKSQLIALVDWIGSSKNNFLLYCHYVEALVAFHRYYGGKDK